MTFPTICPTRAPTSATPLPRGGAVREELRRVLRDVQAGRYTRTGAIFHTYRKDGAVINWRTCGGAAAEAYGLIQWTDAGAARLTDKGREVLG